MARCEDESRLWYSFLGHVNFKVMRLMSTTNMVLGMPAIQPEEVCTACLMSKKTRKTFPSQLNFIATAPLELIHSDLCGPLLACTPKGNKCNFVLTDDYSHVMWTFLLKNKSEIF